MPEQPTTLLRDMIQQALDTGITLRQLAERAVDPRSGETVSKDTINKIVLGRITRMPVEEHLRGIAAALHVPYEHVRQAAIAQWLPAEGESTAAQEAERPDEIAEIRQIARELLDRTERLQTDRQTDPGASPRSA